MKTSYIYLGLITILMWNGMLIKRDQELFKAHDRVCAELPKSHPDCQLTK
jgi:hypothetical protein